MPEPASSEFPAPPRWHRRPEARPDEILDAAQKVFGEFGFARAKLDDVARFAGVSKGTLYLYFDSKDTLFREMVRAKVVTGLAESEALLASHTGPYRELLIQLMEGMFYRLRDHDLVQITRVVQAEFASFPSLPGSTSTRSSSAPAVWSSRCCSAGWQPASSARSCKASELVPCPRSWFSRPRSSVCSGNSTPKL